MSRTNDITGAVMTTKAATDAYREGFDRIFGKKTKELGVPQPLHTESVLDHLAHRDAEMSDREWAAQPANLREGATTHVPGVGDV